MIGETAKAMGAKRARNAMRVCETELHILKERFLRDREKLDYLLLSGILGL